MVPTGKHCPDNEKSYRQLSPTGGNIVECWTHDRKVVGLNFAGGICQGAELDENIKGPVVYRAAYGPGT